MASGNHPEKAERDELAQAGAGWQADAERTGPVSVPPASGPVGQPASGRPPQSHPQPIPGRMTGPAGRPQPGWGQQPAAGYPPTGQGSAGQRPLRPPAPQPYGYPQAPASAAQRPPLRQPQRAPLRPLAKPGRAAPRPAPRQERNPQVTEFVLHQFPLGYIPVAASQPSQQLPEVPPHRGGCFPPQDHPESRVVTDGDALQRFRCGQAQQARQERSADDAPEPIPAELTEHHRRHGEHSELDWEHAFVRRDGEHLGYVWPDAEEHPEGGREPGQPVVLQPDTVLDRLGDGEGRLLFAVRTPFPRRSQPPEFADRPYRRYRVMRPLPVWESVTAGWFGQPGGGTRYRTTYPIADLVALGHLVELTPELVAAEADTQRLDLAADQAAPTEDSAAEETQN